MNEKVIMDNFEKVEKLRERANVSYEEAKEALEHANGDLLDAMVYLEQNGKTAGPAQSTQSTRFEEQETYEKVSETVRMQEGEDASERFAKSLKRFFKTIGTKIVENELVMDRKEKQVFAIPLWVALIIVLICWEWIWVVLIVSLFFGCRYSFRGKNRDDNENENVNEILTRASDIADNVKEEFRGKTS